MKCNNPIPVESLELPGRRNFNVCATCHRDASFYTNGTVRHYSTKKATIAKRIAA